MTASFSPTRVCIFVFGLGAYLAFLAAILYLIGFTSGLGVPKTIDDGYIHPAGQAAAVDVALIMLFGLSHSLMARPAFKERLTALIPRAAERSIFVLTASLMLGLTYWQWQPLPQPVWHLQGELPVLAVRAVQAAGWVIVFWSTFLIDHFDLFGLRQVWLNLKGQEYRPTPFVVRGLYRFVRHPLMLGFLIAFWAEPDMTAGHLLFSGAMTLYIAIGIHFEERDLSRILGTAYNDYRNATSMLLPLPPRGKGK